MAYVSGNPRSKKAIKDGIAAGKEFYAYGVGLEPDPPANGTVFIKGPHYPEPHRWYGNAVVRDGLLISVK